MGHGTCLVLLGQVGVLTQHGARGSTPFHDSVFHDVITRCLALHGLYMGGHDICVCQWAGPKLRAWSDPVLTTFMIVFPSAVRLHDIMVVMLRSLVNLSMYLCQWAGLKLRAWSGPVLTSKLQSQSGDRLVVSLGVWAGPEASAWSFP